MRLRLGLATAFVLPFEYHRLCRISPCDQETQLELAAGRMAADVDQFFSRNNVAAIAILRQFIQSVGADHS